MRCASLCLLLFSACGLPELDTARYPREAYTEYREFEGHYLTESGAPIDAYLLVGSHLSVEHMLYCTSAGAVQGAQREEYQSLAAAQLGGCTIRTISLYMPQATFGAFARSPLLCILDDRGSCQHTAPLCLLGTWGAGCRDR